ncbi:serine/threonine protein kinase [Rubripirellula reticaptiva]|uniref:non-specific serine/threonine protein kinase n=1 Tax=Rubripirellula reticaptiva TaxID=2528013 RepID=A0A5C6EC00_9BACT|nr:serine/threonine-protein kinase [Rubripirellula reticaptiva]TWU46418.1 Serine/threonine-protein kinase Pkn1 [Rubripirellula reticaptiva]
MPPDEYLGPYKIGALIGRGGMGAVYAGEHAKTGEKCAVKLIAAHVSDDPRFRRRFDSEIRALKLLKHRNIVRIIGEGEDEEGRLFYSMELIDGETLQARIRRQKKLSWQSTVGIAIQIAAALKHAHDIGVTHRDLKPANLILTADDTVKLVDFGIPKVFGDDREQTQLGSVLGTPDYMAPEQAVGGPITPRTDLYALGSVMYAMLLGRAPFKGKNATDVIDALRRDRPVPLDLVNSALPEELTALVHQLLEKKPEDRPPTALSVINRLKAILAEPRHHETQTGKSSATNIGDRSDGETNLVDPVTTDSDDTREGFLPRGETPLSTATSPRSSETSRRYRVADEISTPGLATAVSRRDQTVESTTSGGESLDFPNQSNAPENGEVRRARFATVDLESPILGSPEHRSHPLLHGIAIAGMIAVLMAVGYLAFRMLQPLGPDASYQAAIESGEVAKLSSFLRRFPDDERANEIRDLQMELRVAATLRRFSAQDKIGIVELGPAELGFIAALKDRKTKPNESAERVGQWLNVFDGSAEAESAPVLAELLELARYQRDRLKTRSPQRIEDSRTAELLKEVRDIRLLSNKDEIRKKLTGIIETFGDLGWAEPAVEEARKRLQQL